MAHECAKGHDSCRRVIPNRIDGMVNRIRALESDVAFLCSGQRQDEMRQKDYELKKAIAVMKYNRNWFNETCDQVQDKACRKAFIAKYQASAVAGLRALRTAFPNDVTEAVNRQ